MKKLIVVLVLTSILIGACGPSDTKCQLAWDQMGVGVYALDYDTYEEYVDAFKAEAAMVASLIINKNHAPGTVGEILQKCINNGWDGWR